jgi:hypothetical protein
MKNSGYLAQNPKALRMSNDTGNKCPGIFSDMAAKELKQRFATGGPRFNF